jgi:hypothetical protein
MRVCADSSVCMRGGDVPASNNRLRTGTDKGNLTV